MLQSLEQELFDLDNADLLVLEEGDKVAKETVDRSSRDWEAFAYHASTGKERQDQKRNIMLKASILMKEYGMYPSKISI